MCGYYGGGRHGARLLAQTREHEGGGVDVDQYEHRGGGDTVDNRVELLGDFVCEYDFAIHIGNFIWGL